MEANAQPQPTQTRTVLMTNATTILKPIKNKKILVDRYNRYSGQKQMSLPRIAVKLRIENGVPFHAVEDYINMNYNTYYAQEPNRNFIRLEETRLRNEAHALKVAEIQKKRQNDIRRSIIQDRLDERAFRISREVDMKADDAINALETIRDKKKKQLKKWRLRLQRQKENLELKFKNGLINREFYKDKKKQHTERKSFLNGVQKKYENSEYNRMEKEKLRINLERK